MTDCPVCYDTYTGVQRRPVPCPGCGFAACVRCVKTGLLSSLTEPACMSCHRAWNRAFLDEHLARTWVSGPLHEHRGAVLFDRERSMLPATQAAVAVEKRKRDAQAALDAIAAERAPLAAAAKEAVDASMVADMARLAAAAKEAVDASMVADRDYYSDYEAATQLAAAAMAALRKFDRTHIARARELKYVARNGPRREEGAAGGAESERAKFVAACPRGDCRGFLSTQYKCGTCTVQFCSKCREPTEEGHECDPDLVATIAAIVADSRPCPSCATPISRVSGCDQMWCTECRTPFSYATGQVVRGVIHNPHYFQQMAALRAAGGAAEDGAPPPCGDDAVDDLEIRLWRILRRDRAMLGKTYVVLSDLWYAFADLRLRRLPEYRRGTDNTDLRVQFLLNEIEEAVLKKKLSARQRESDCRNEIRDVFETAVGALLEFFIALPLHWVNPLDPATVVAPLTELEAKREPLINAPLRAIAARYGRAGFQFTPLWQVEKPKKTIYTAAAGGGS